jgi:hypothetical protein
MKSLLELDQFDLESASQQQVADLVQALLEQVKKDAVLLQSNQAELQSKEDKIGSSRFRGVATICSIMIPVCQ